MKSMETNLIITGIRSKVDGSLSITATTPELTPEEKAEFMRLQCVNLNVVFTPLDEKEAPRYKVDKELETKTPGNRLRNSLYIYWQQEGSQGEFDEFYKQKMNSIIEAVKDKLE